MSQCATLGEDSDRAKGAVATLLGENHVREDGVAINIKQQYDQHGCVLLCSRSDVDDVCSLEVVSVGRLEHGSDWCGCQTVAIGDVAEAEMQKFDERFEAALTQLRKEWKSSKPSPQFIECAAKMAATETSTVPQVCKSDFSAAAQPSWPWILISCGILPRLLGECLSDRLLLDFDVWMAQTWLEDAVTPLSQGECNEVVGIMESAVSRALLYTEDRKDIDADVVEPLSACKRDLDALLKQQADEGAQQRRLGEIGAHTVLDVGLALIPPPSDSVANEDVAARAAKAIGQMPLVNDCSAARFHLWMQQNSAAFPELAVASVEKYFARLVSTVSAGGALVFQCDTNSIKEIVKRYQALVKGASLISRSHEMVVVVSAYVVVHHMCVQRWPILARYGVAMEYTSLSHVSTDKKETRTQVKQLAKYLQRFSSEAGRRVFSLQGSSAEGTMDFTRGSAEIQQRWKAERAEVAAKQEEFMKALEEKKQQLERLRKELDNERATEVFTYWGRRDQDSRIQDLEDRIRDTKVPPKYVACPLPEHIHYAYPVLFYILMDQDLDVLMCLSFNSQRMLSRGRPGTTEPLHTCGSWATHYNNRRSGKFTSSAERDVDFMPTSDIRVPKSYGPSDIEEIWSATQATWYPDVGSTLWAQDTPFAVLQNSTTEYYSKAVFEGLRPEFAAFLLPPEDSSSGQEHTAGNRGYATMHLKPHAFTVKGHLAFAGVRSFSSSVWRKILRIVTERSLPFAEASVAELLRHSAHQLGAFTERFARKEDGDPFKAAEDLFRPSDPLVAKLVAAFAQLAEEVRECPRDHKGFPVLADLSCFISQFSSDPRGQRLPFLWRGVAARWREVCGFEDVQEVGDKDKEAVMTAYAIRCFLVPKLTAADAALLVEELFRFRQCLARSDEEHPESLATVRRVAAHRLSDVMIHAQADPDTVITPGLRKIFGRMPEYIALWENLSDPLTGTATCCFAAVAEGDHYSVNLLTGAVLLNGYPPCGLPDEVTQCALYKRSFGETRNFEVSKSPSGATFNTLKRDETNCHYDFCICSGTGRVRIFEIREEDGEDNKSELVSLQEAEWSVANLPKMLVDLHTHWHDVSQQTLWFREESYLNKRVQYLMTYTLSATGAPEHAVVHEVPAAEMDQPYKHILSLLSEGHLSRFVAAPLSLVPLFERVEEHVHMHAVVDKNEVLWVRLPRLRLSWWVEGDTVRSEQHPNMRLSSEQQHGCVPLFFQNYLVLEGTAGSTRVLIPCGTIVQDEEGARVAMDGASTSTFKCFAYDLCVRFRQLKAATTTMRLYLAAVFAASGTLVVEQWMGMTAVEFAVQLCRECWSNEPLSAGDMQLLDNVAAFGEDVPVLTLICHDLLRSSFRQCKLWEKDRPERGALEMTRLQEARTEYGRAPGRNWRHALSTWELHSSPMDRKAVNLKSRNDHECTLEEYPGDIKEYVKKEELGLKKRILKATEQEPGFVPPSFPFTCPNYPGLCAELKDSWERHHRTASYDVPSPEFLSGYVTSLKEEVSAKRAGLQERITDCTTEQAKRHSASFELLHCVNGVPTVTFRDMALLAGTVEFSPSHELNPFLTYQQRVILQNDARRLLELCVLEDKLERILRLVQGDNTRAKIVQELRCVRDWDGDEHPHWLVFEAEGSLQIRPHQYDLAKHLLHHPGSISQLNMGLGKTRVILPMLLLELTRLDAKKAEKILPQIVFLRSLLKEGQGFLSNTLTASTRNLRVYMLPFHRNIELDVPALEGEWREAQRAGGVVLSVPEYKLSLCLKRHELAMHDKPAEAKLLRHLQTMDKTGTLILDESDELLHHRYQLVYAVGKGDSLVDGAIRYEVAAAVLTALNRRGKTLDNIAAVIEVREGIDRFQGFRLVDGRSTHDANVAQLNRVVLDLLCEEIKQHGAPWCLRWLKDYSAEALAMVKDSVLNGSKGADMRFALLEHQRLQLMCLRGLFAHELLAHCLTKRHRVEYGVAYEKRKINLAVPFKAADVPTERSEFSHPDVMVLHTMLAHYYDGLNTTQVGEAVGKLLELSDGAQNYYYKSWFASVASQPSDFSSIDCVRKLDPTNREQHALLHSTYQYSMPVINFWMTQIVLPSEVVAYPEKLSMSAWDLPDRRSVGFSGTNDNHQLLPSYVTQREPDVEELKATNGLMLSHLMRSTVHMIGHVAGRSTGEAALLAAVTGKAGALIDTGSLLAGMPPKEAAAFVLRQASFKLLGKRGVMYFETEASEEGWKVMYTDTNLVSIRHECALTDDVFFAIFDNARCRGSDLKLAQDCVGAVTLGRNLRKDMLMQGAGRMRQLGPQQQGLMLLCPEDVRGQISQSTPSIEEVLGWVIENTGAERERGLSQWADNGVFHYECKNNPRAIQADDQQPLSKYTHPLVETDLEPLVQEQLRNTKVGEYGKECEVILRCCKDLGSGLKVKSTVSDRECEKEKEAQQEQENEQEVERESMKPLAEKVWDYRLAATASSWQAFCATLPWNVVTVSTLQDIWDSAFPGATLRWGSAKLCATSNWKNTVCANNEETALRTLRLVDAVLTFPTGHMLLLSDREADGVLAAMLEEERRHGGAAGEEGKLENCGVDDTLGVETRETNLETTALKLLNGICNGYSSGPELEALDSIVTPNNTFVLRLVAGKGTSSHYHYSQLQKTAERVA